MDYALNIAGGEWMIIVLAVLFLLLGTNKLPEAARKIGKIAGEYDKARTEFNRAGQFGGAGPTKAVESEREKLDAMANMMGIESDGRTDDELRKLIADGVGGR